MKTIMFLDQVDTVVHQSSCDLNNDALVPTKFMAGDEYEIDEIYDLANGNCEIIFANGDYAEIPADQFIWSEDNECS